MPKIMVVEDEGIVARNIKSRLEMLGYTVPAMVSSGEKVLETARQVRPDLILMDIRLQDRMDGIEAAQQIKQHCNIPVVYLTAYVDEDTIQRAKVTAPYGYIVKPFSYADMHANIEMALYRHQQEQQRKWDLTRFLETLNFLSDAFIIADYSNAVLLMNRTAESLTGWKHIDAVGKGTAEVICLFAEDTGKLLENPVQKCLNARTRIMYQKKVIIRSAAGTDTKIDFIAVPIIGKEKTIVGAISFLLQDDDHFHGKDLMEMEIKEDPQQIIDLIKQIQDSVKGSKYRI